MLTLDIVAKENRDDASLVLMCCDTPVIAKIEDGAVVCEECDTAYGIEDVRVLTNRAKSAIELLLKGLEL